MSKIETVFIVSHKLLNYLDLVGSSISEREYFNSFEEAKDYVEKEDPDKFFAWDIYRVQISKEWSV